MTKPVTVRITVRVYETDAQGHLDANVYLQHAGVAADPDVAGL